MSGAKQSGKAIGLVFGLALLLPSFLTAEEPPEPLLVAHDHALDHVTPAAPPAALKPKVDIRTFLRRPTPRAWSVEGFVGSVFVPQQAPTQPALNTVNTPFLFAATRRQSQSTVERITPLPRNLPATTFPYSRVRGPFEQVLPRPW